MECVSDRTFTNSIVFSQAMCSYQRSQLSWLRLDLESVSYIKTFSSNYTYEHVLLLKMTTPVATPPVFSVSPPQSHLIHIFTASSCYLNHDRPPPALLDTTTFITFLVPTSSVSLKTCSYHLNLDLLTIVPIS